MDCQHGAVSLGDAEHLLSDDTTCKGLAQVLNHLAAVDVHIALACRIRILNSAPIIHLSYPQVHVLQRQTARQVIAKAGQYAHSLWLLAEGSRLQRVASQCFQRSMALVPKRGDVSKLMAIHLQDVLAQEVGQAHTEVFELQLELLPTHAIASAKNRGLANEALGVSNLVHILVVNLSGHQLVHIFALLESINQIVLTSQPCNDTRFDLRRVGVNEHIAIRHDDG